MNDGDIQQVTVMGEAEVFMGFWGQLDQYGSLRQLGSVKRDADSCSCPSLDLCSQDKILGECEKPNFTRIDYPKCKCSCESRCDVGFEIVKKDCTCRCEKIKCKRTERQNIETC